MVLPASALADSVVVNTDGFGTGSLRQALVDANAAAGPDTITFAPSVTGTITVNSELPVIHGTTIKGPGADVLTVSGVGSRAFAFNPSSAATLEIEGLTVKGAPASGTNGGGIAAICSAQQGTLVLRNARVTGSAVANAAGGGIFSDGCDLSVVGSTLSGNMATTGGDGGAIFVRDSPGGGTADLLLVTDSIVTGNSAADDGAGILASKIPGPVTIIRSTISGNSTTGVCGCGGGLYTDKVGPVTVDSSTFAGNQSGAGGGLFQSFQTQPFTMRNSTVTANSGQGGGLYLTNGTSVPFRIENSTIAGNSAGTSEGGGIYMFGGGAESDIALSSTIVAGNSAANGPDLHSAISGNGGFLADHSLIGTTVGGADLVESQPGTNLLNVGDPGLNMLGENGGPTQTMLPSPTSPVIDAGTANGLTTDQRGLARSVNQPGAQAGDGTDIGAAELQDSTLEGASLKAKKKQKAKGRKVVITVEAGAAENVTARASGTVKLGKNKLALSKPNVEIAAGETKALKLKPANKKSLKKIVKALARGRKAKASLTVEFTDVAGNASSIPAEVTLSAKKS